MIERKRTRLSPTKKNEIWGRWKAGQSMHEIGRAYGRPHPTIRKLLLPRGGIAPIARRRSRVALTLAEREDISRGIASDSSIREIARGLSRATSTVSREIVRHGGRPAYRAHDADGQAWQSALRPSAWRIEKRADGPLAVEAAHASLAPFQRAWTCTGADRRCHLDPRTASGSGRPSDPWPLGRRSAGRRKNSYIATLVERHSRFLVLIKVRSKDTAVVVAALSKHVRKLPATLRRSLTWDRGLEMAKHKVFTVATNVQVYFCDPQSPWQRGTNENTNLLLRQYFPRGTDLSAISQEQLDQVELLLNQRPRKILGFQTPASKLQASVASTI